MKKYISMEPREITLENLRDDTKLEGDALVTWKKFLEKVEDHPQWGTTYKLQRIMDAIWAAHDAALERGDWIMILEEDEHKELEKVCRNPKFQYRDATSAMREGDGWGLSNQFSRQILCFSVACINPTDKDPRPEPEPEPNPKVDAAAAKAKDDLETASAELAADHEAAAKTAVN